MRVLTEMNNESIPLYQMQTEKMIQKQIFI